MPADDSVESRSPAVLAIGVVSVDHYIRVAALPRTDEKVNGRRLGWFAGGMAPNFAVAARQFGARTRLISTFGGDQEAAVIRGLLENRHQVDTEGSVVVAGTASLSSLSLLDDNAEKVLVILDTELPLPDAGYAAALAGTGAWDVVYLVALDAAWCRGIGRAAQEAGAMVAYDLEPFFVEEAWGTPDFSAMMETAHVVFMKLHSVRTAGFTEAVRAAEVIQAMGPEVVVVTDGPRSIFCAAGSDRFEVLPAKVRVLDPTGAGDAFAGTFCSLYAQRRPVEDCLVTATAVGALAVIEVGCQSYAPVRRELLDAICKDVSVTRLA